MKGLGLIAVAMFGLLAVGCEQAPLLDEDLGDVSERAISVPEYSVVYAYELRNARDIIDPQGPSARRADGCHVRLVSIHQPMPDAVNVEPTLEDVFLYYIQANNVSAAATEAVGVAA